MIRKRCSKGVLGIITAMCFVIIALTTSDQVFAADGVADSDSDFTISYSEDEEEVYITGLAAEVADGITSISIPSTINDKPVTQIAANAFSGKTKITKVVIPDSVTTIGDNAFKNCIAVKEFTIPIDIRANNAFQGCVSTEKITYTPGHDGKMIDKAVYDWYQFYYGNSLESISTALKTIVFKDGVEYIGSYAFYSRKNLINITMPNNDISIGYQAFYDCSSIEKIDLSNVISYGEYAFYNCNSLKEINLGKKITTISSNVFNQCDSITELVIPENIESMGVNAFANCTGLKTVTIAADLRSYSVFTGCTSIKKVIYTKGKTGRIPDSDVYDWYENYYKKSVAGVSSVLEEIDLTDGIEYVGNHSFRDFPALTKVDMPSSDISLGYAAFYNCPELQSISTSNIISYGEYSFGECKSLKSVSFNSSIESIPSFVFFGCESLKEIVIPDTIRKIGARAFENCISVTKVTIPADVRSYSVFTGCTAITNIVFTEGETGVIPNSDVYDWYENYYGKSIIFVSDVLTSVYLSDGIVEIGNHTFRDRESLVDVRMPDNEIAVGYAAFYNCPNIQEIDTSNVIMYGQYAFGECKSLKSFVINEKVDEIPAYTFTACEALEEINIPDNVSKIGVSAFEKCSGVTRVTLPVDIPTYNVFTGCTSITEIDFTKGRNGVMPDSSGVDYYSNYYRNTVAYTSENLSKIVFGEGVTRIGNHSFRDLATKPEFVFPKEGYAVGEYAFYNNPELEINDVSKITTVGAYAFYGCTNLTELKFDNLVTSIGDYAFYGCNISGEIIIPIEVVYGNNSFSEYADVNKITYTNGLNGVSTNSTGHTQANSLERKVPGLKTVVFEEKITSIHAGMFGAEANKSIENVKFPSTIISVDKGAFVNELNATFYGTKDSAAEKYVKNDETIEFRPLNYIVVNSSVDKSELGKEEQFDAVVYTDIDTTGELTWTVKDNNSKKTVIDNTGKLTVGDNEKSREIKVCITFDEKTNVELPVTIDRSVFIVEFDAGKGVSSEEAIATTAEFKLKELPTAKYDFYTFDGWFTEEKDGELITTDTEFKDDTVVYAHYSKTPVSIIDIKAGTQPKSGAALDASVKSISDNVDADSVKTTFVAGDKAAEGNAKCNTTYSIKVTFKLKNGYTNSDKTVLKINDTPVELKKLDAGEYEGAATFKATTHGETILKNAKEATQTEDGYTGDKCCSVCNEVIEKGQVIPKKTSGKTETTEKKPAETSVDGVGTISADGKILTDTTGKKYYVAAKVTASQLKANLMVADKKSGGKYKITKVTKNKKTKKVTGGTVTYMAPYNRNCTKATMPEFVKIAGVKFKVTALNKNAFKNCKKITNVTIGKNITKIGANAFSGCTKLKSVSIRATSLKSIGSNAFKGISAKARFKVPKKQYTKYSKMIKKAKAPKTAKISK